MNHFDYDAFMHEANVAFIQHEGDLRYGQFLMNYLHEKHPNIHVPPYANPFYDCNKCGEFLKFLAGM